MNLSQSAIKEFQELYFKEYRVKLSSFEAQQKAVRLLRLFELYTDAYLWDERYREEYGTVSFPDRVVAKFLGWSPSKVCRIRAKLIEKGLVTEVARGIHAVNPVFEYKSKLANMKQIIADTQQENSPVDQDVASVQQDRTQKGEDSLLSFKGDLVSSPDEDSDIPF